MLRDNYEWVLFSSRFCTLTERAVDSLRSHGKPWSWEQSDFITHTLQHSSILLPRYFHQARTILFFSWRSNLCPSEHHLWNLLLTKSQEPRLRHVWHFKLSSSAVGGLLRHRTMFTSIPGLYPLNASSTTTSRVLPVMTIKTVSRSCQTSPAGRKSQLV